MPDVKEVITDRTILHQVRIERLTADLRQKVTSHLVELRKDILGRIAGTTSQERLNQLNSAISEIDALIRKRYASLTDEQYQSLQTLAGIENRATRAIINAAVGFTVMDRSLSARWINAATSEVSILGAPAVAWWSAQEERTLFEFKRQMRQGIMASETIQELTSRVGGIILTQKRHAEALARTSALSVANAAREQTFKDHEEIFNGYQAIATLDLRTTQICMSRDGLQWDVAGNPIDHDQKWPGFPPWHWNCRSTMIGVLKSWEDISRNKSLAKRFDKAGKQTRASMDGQVPDQVSYEDWIKVKDQRFKKMFPNAKNGVEGVAISPAREVLGAAKYKLWSQGKLSFRDMVDQSGNPLSVEKLKEIYGG